MIKLDKKSIAWFVATCLILTGLFYLLYEYGFIEYFTDRQRLLHFINMHRAYAALIFIGLQILQVVAAPVPGEVTGFVGGVFFGTAWGILYSTIGLTLGSWLAFLLARLAGRPLVEMIVNPETVKRYDYVMKHKGMFLAFLMFLIPGFPKDILCYLLGLGHMGQGDFLLVSTTGRLLGTGFSPSADHFSATGGMGRCSRCRCQHFPYSAHHDLPRDHRAMVPQNAGRTAPKAPSRPRKAEEGQIGGRYTPFLVLSRLSRWTPLTRSLYRLFMMAHTSSGSSTICIRSRSSGLTFPSATIVFFSQSNSPSQYALPTRTTGNSVIFLVWMSVSASNSSSMVPNPPGKMT